MSWQQCKQLRAASVVLRCFQMQIHSLSPCQATMLDLALNDSKCAPAESIGRKHRVEANSIALPISDRRALAHTEMKLISLDTFSSLTQALQRGF